MLKIHTQKCKMCRWNSRIGLHVGHIAEKVFQYYLYYFALFDLAANDRSSSSSVANGPLSCTT